MKSTILLTIAIFMAIAPSPDSKVISEVSAGFLASGDNPGMMTDGPALNSINDKGAPAKIAALFMKEETRTDNSSI